MAWYNRGKAAMLNPSFAGIGEPPLALLLDNITIGLMVAAFTFDADNSVYSDISANGLAALGYTEPGAAGANSLATKTVSQDDANDRSEFDALDLVFATIGNGTNGTFEDIVVCRQQDAGMTEANTQNISNAAVGATTTNGGNITLIWNAEGIIQIT